MGKTIKHRNMPTTFRTDLYGSKWHLRKYPFDLMSIGQHFPFPLDKIGNVKSAAYAYKKSHPGFDYSICKTRLLLKRLG